MSLEKNRLLNLQLNAELFAAFGIQKSQSDLWALKKKSTPKRLSEPLGRPKKPQRRSLRLQNLPVNMTIETEEIPYKEDIRKPVGDFSIEESLLDAGTNTSRQQELKNMYQGEIQVFDDSAPSNQSLPAFVTKLKSLKMTPFTVTKVAQRRANCMTFHPMLDEALLLMADVIGNLGLWNVLKPRNAPILMQPHASCITAVAVHPKTPTSVITSSFDCCMRATDMIAMKVLELYRSPDDTPVTSFDFASPNVVIKGQTNTKATLLDLRASNSSKPIAFMCSKNRRVTVKSISVHPVRSEIFATATNGGTVLLWDQRKQNQWLEELPHIRTVQWCRFSPCSGSRLLTSSTSDEIRIYDMTVLSQGAAARPMRVIRHDNNTGRFIAPFRPVWVPQREDSFLVGSMKFPREIEVYNAQTGAKAASIQHELLSSINSQVAFHPTLNYLVGGNSSGRAHAFIP